MALFSNFFSFLFFTFLLSSLQINARESQFFSKVTRANNNDDNNNNNKYSGSVNQAEFTPETENNYGLYGHESGLHPPTTTTTVAAATTNAAPYTSTNTYHTYKTESEDTKNNYYNNNGVYNTNQNKLSDTRLAEASYSSNNYNNDAYDSKQNELIDTKYMEGEDKSLENQNNNQKFYNNNVSPYTTTYQTYRTESEDTKNNPTYNNYYNKDTFSTNQNDLSNTRLAGTSYSSSNNNYKLNKDAYGSKQNELSDTKYTEREYKSMENQNNNQRYYNNNNNNAANERYNGERQGLSDTRFMDGGKYFYDAANPERHNPTLNGGSSRGINSENLYNNKGYIGRNNANSYENKKYSMDGYQNQEEFEDDQDNFEVEP